MSLDITLKIPSSGKAKEFLKLGDVTLKLKLLVLMLWFRSCDRDRLGVLQNPFSLLP